MTPGRDGKSSVIYAKWQLYNKQCKVTKDTKLTCARKLAVKPA